VTDKVKELLFQTLTEEKDYLPPEDLTSVKNDLDVFGTRNLWHGFFLILVVDILHKDLVTSRKLLLKLIVFLLQNLHQL